MKLWAALLLPLAALAQEVIPARIDRELRDVLRLTDVQYGTLFRNTSQHRAAQTGTLTRVTLLNREIENETRREQPDIGALGASYQEIESQCRRYAESMRDLNQLQLRALNDEQRAALRGLSEQARLTPLFFPAEALFLIPKRDATAEFRWTDVSLVNDVPADLAVYLSLTPSQLEAIRSAVRGHRDFVASRRARVGEVNQEIETEMARPAPSGIELGMRYWEIEAHRRQIVEREASLRKTTPELLNAEQRTRLLLLVQPVERLQVISQAESNGLIAAATTLPASQPGTFPSFIAVGPPVAFPTGSILPRNTRTTEPVAARIAACSLTVGAAAPRPCALPVGLGRSCVGTRPAIIFDPVPL